MPPMKVLLYGGTFDPPHGGHLNLLQGAVRAVQPDRVIVMPAGIPPHKVASATPAPLRLAMCECFRLACPNAQISDWEISRGGKSYTVDTAAMLAARYPGAQLYLCMGGDMVETFRQWRCWQRLLQLCTLVVHCREPEDPAFAAAAESLRRDGGRVIVLKAPVLRESSSSLRARMGRGEPPEALLPPAAARVARRYRLYCRAQRPAWKGE